MKKKLVLASKIAFGVFLLLLLGVCMIMAYGTQKNASTWSAVVFIPFVIAMIVNGILFAIEFVLEVRELWKENGILGIVRILIEGIIAILVFMGCDFLMDGSVERIRSYVIYGVVLVIMMSVINYWKRVKKERF